VRRSIFWDPDSFFVSRSSKSGLEFYVASNNRIVWPKASLNFSSLDFGTSVIPSNGLSLLPLGCMSCMALAARNDDWARGCGRSLGRDSVSKEFQLRRPIVLVKMNTYIGLQSGIGEIRIRMTSLPWRLDQIWVFTAIMSSNCFCQKILSILLRRLSERDGQPNWSRIDETEVVCR